MFELTLAQQVLVIIVGVLLIGSIVALLRGWAGKREGLIWAAVFLAALVAILWPGATSRVARTIGIGRGADLILYIAVIVMLAGFWAIYIRLRRVRREITLLVRHQALLEAERNLSQSSDSATPPAPGPKTPAKGD